MTVDFLTGANLRGPLQQSGSAGSTGQVLTSAGTGAVPTWQASSSSPPSWHGVIYGAWGSCDPQELYDAAVLNGTFAGGSAELGQTTARIAYFVPPANITVNKIRFISAGNAGTVFNVAIYNGDTLARLMPVQNFGGGSGWQSAGTGLNLALTAGQLYFIAFSTTANTGNTGPLCISPAVTGLTGQIGIAPKSFPGSLDIDSKYITGAFGQFSTSSGALPDPAPTITGQGSWTSGFPAFWLDSNNA